MLRFDIVDLAHRCGLRYYQCNGVEEIFLNWELGGKRRVLYQLATGGGKTAVGVFLAVVNMAYRKGSRVVWLTHRQELREQSLGRLRAAGAQVQDLTQVPVKKRRLPAGMVTMVSPGLQGISFEEVTDADLLVVDEAHHAAASSWAGGFVQPWPGYVLGLTATPWRMSKKQGFDHLFDHLVSGPAVESLVAGGWLCPVRLLAVPESEAIRGAGRDHSGDYSPSQTVEANRPILYGKLPVRIWERSVPPGVRTVWYVPTVDAGHALTANLLEAGHRAGFVHAGTPDAERRRLVADFAAGSVLSLVNVAVVTEGFDCPEAGCVVIARPTKSLALYLQMVGRAMRPAEGKELAYVLDLGMSWQEKGIGHPMDARTWSLQARSETHSDGDGDMFARECPECGTVAPAAMRQCRECGHYFGMFCEGCGRFRYERRWSFGKDICDECELSRVGGIVRLRERAHNPWRESASGTAWLEVLGHQFLVASSRYGAGWVAGYVRRDGSVKWRGPYPDRLLAQAYVEVFLETHIGRSSEAYWKPA